MFKAEQFRAKAAQSAESMKNTDIPSEVSKFHQSMESFSLLAQNEDWLADNYDKMLHSQDMPSQDAVITKTRRESPMVEAIFSRIVAWLKKVSRMVALKVNPHEFIPVLATLHSRTLDTIGRRAYSFRGSGRHELRHA